MINLLDCQVSNRFLLVIILFVRDVVTIYSSSSHWHLFGVNIVECIRSSTKYIPSNRNKYTFIASTFLEALKWYNKIWNSITTVASTLKSSILCCKSKKSLLTFIDFQTSYINVKVSWNCIVHIISRASSSLEINSMSSCILLSLVKKLTTNSIIAGFKSFPRFPYFFHQRRRFCQSLPIK